MKKILKKMVAVVAATTMVMAMGVSAFAATTDLNDGKYTATAHLYKDEACTEISMGDEALVSTEVEINGDEATIKFTTKDIEVTRLNITVTGHLDSMVLYDADGTTYTARSDDGYVYTVYEFPADQLEDGAVFAASFKANVVIIPVDMSGYLKFTNFVAQ